MVLKWVIVKHGKSCLERFVARLQKDKGRELTKGEVQTTMKALTLLKTKGSIKMVEEIDDNYENNEGNQSGVKNNSLKKKWGFKGIKTSLAGKFYILFF